jgi:glycosyltransferase involved in cell wall biosynthesis
VNYLFIHQNFPGQYVHVARHLAEAGHRVLFITQQSSGKIDGVRKIIYAPTRAHPAMHPYLSEFNASVTNGLSVAGCCEALKREGFTPDLVVGHNGWGEILYVKDVWPKIPLLGYFEFFYRSAGSDLDFDPEFPTGPEDPMRIRTRNAINLLGLHAADWGQTPTQWQRAQYPRRYWNRISIAHEGIDTDLVRPERTARVFLEGRRSFSCSDEVITYSARNLEPYRGFHILMRSLPEVLRQRSDAHVLIVGGNGVSYGRLPSGTKTWREKLLLELDGQLDLRRVHFLGKLAYRQYIAILQVSTVHVYLTYPFVLSWSLIEAMSAGCVVIGSRTPPVEEVIVDGENGWLVDFFDIARLSDTIARACAERGQNEGLRESARTTVRTRYDLKRICLPRHLTLFRKLTRTARARLPATDRSSSILSFDGQSSVRNERKRTGLLSRDNVVLSGHY